MKNLTKAETHEKKNDLIFRPEIIYERSLSKIETFFQEDSAFIFSDGVSSLKAEIINEHIIRIRLAPEGVFMHDFSYAVLPSVKTEAKITFKETDSQFKIQTASVHCQINKKDFKISFEDTSEKTFFEENKALYWERNGLGGFKVYCSQKTNEDEAFYGLGDKSSSLNLRGRKFENWNSDAFAFKKNQDPLYKTIPFYIGQKENGDAYGIFFDNTFKSYFDFDSKKDNSVEFWAEGGEMNYYYIHGPSMTEVIQRYHSLTGVHPLPPLWALGFQQSRYSYFPEKKVLKIAETFRKKEIPCDSIYLDIDYMDGYRCFTWDKKRFPNPKKMIETLSNSGFKTVIMIDLGIKVDENYKIYKEGTQQDYFCKRSDGEYMEGYVWPGLCRFPDFTRKEVREWWGELYQDMLDLGVEGVWNDMNEPAVFGDRIFPLDVRHDFDGNPCSHRKAHNIYGMQMIRATYEGIQKIEKNKRIFTLTRAAYSGTQRYGATWTGDNLSTWEHLKVGIIQLQRLSVSGYSFSGTDIGGFTGEPGGELFTRWIQFGVFSPLMRIHSDTDSSEREPWSYGKEYEKINKKFIELRYELLPYIYTTFWEHQSKGLPILRPLSLLEPQNQENSKREETFAFGDKILVKPVTKPKIKTTSVYLPNSDEQWYYYWNNKLYSGGKKHRIPTPLDEMPFFIKAGTVLPKYPIIQNTEELKSKNLRLNIYYAPYALESIIYEDNGKDFSYQKGNLKLKTFVTTGNKNTFQVTQKTEGKFNEKYNFYEVNLIGIPFSIKEIKVNGKVYPFQTDEKGEINLKIPKEFINLEVL